MTRQQIAEGQRLFIRDQVRDGCWTNSNAVKTAVELELKRSNYTVATDATPRFYFGIEIIVTGYEMNSRNTCVVHSRINFFSSADQSIFLPGGNEVYARRPQSIDSTERILHGPKEGMNSRLREEYIEVVQMFLNSIDTKQKEVINEVKNSKTIDQATKDAFLEKYQ